MGPALSRRRILGGGLLFLVAYGSAFAVGHFPLSRVVSQGLGASRLITLQAAFEALLPTREDARVAAGGVDEFMARGDPVAREELRLALFLLEHGGGFSWFSFKRFSRLSVERREQILESWLQSRIPVLRQVSQGIRKAGYFTHFSRPETWMGIGYDGPWVGRRER